MQMSINGSSSPKLAVIPGGMDSGEHLSVDGSRPCSSDQVERDSYCHQNWETDVQEGIAKLIRKRAAGGKTSSEEDVSPSLPHVGSSHEHFNLKESELFLANDWKYDKPSGNEQSAQEVLEAIRCFGESIMKIEDAKLEMHRDVERLRAEAECGRIEMEKRRTEIELKRTEMLLTMQQQVSKLLLAKNKKRKHEDLEHVSNEVQKEGSSVSGSFSLPPDSREVFPSNNTISELQKAETISKEGLIRSLLPVLDNFEKLKHTIKAETEKERAISKSYQDIYKQLMEILKSHGLSRIETTGKEFVNPSVHKAVAHMEPSEPFYHT